MPSGVSAYHSRIAVVGASSGQAGVPAEFSGGGARLGGRPLLTPFGRSLRTVVVVGLAGGVCDVRRDDWRNTLPRALAGFMSHAETVVYAPTIYSTKQCFHCRSGGGDGQTFDCDEWHSRRKDRRSADLLIIIGTGRTNTGRGKAPTNSTRAYPSVNEALRKRWVGRDTVVVMLPVRKLGGLMTNPHGFQMMIPDASFFKPLAPGIADKLALCARPEVPKAKDLMYVARYQGEKGQLNFLQHVEPRLMDGYTVKFFGKGAGGYAQRIRDAAARRNISAEVSPRHISHERLMLQTCASRGQVHLAQADSHPRAAYEGLYAGNPLLVSRRANLPDALLQQPFVVAVDPADPASLNEGAARFMELVKRDTRQEIAGWLAANAAPRAVYFELCVRIGVCAYEGTPGAGPVWDRTTLGLIDTISGGLALEARGGADGEEGGGAVWSPHSEGEAEDAGERGVGDM
eukprot:jgi/Tetstr1/464496/TSEL_009254.t1